MAALTPQAPQRISRLTSHRGAAQPHGAEYVYAGKASPISEWRGMRCTATVPESQWIVAHRRAPGTFGIHDIGPPGLWSPIGDNSDSVG